MKTNLATPAVQATAKPSLVKKIVVMSLAKPGSDSKVEFKSAVLDLLTENLEPLAIQLPTRTARLMRRYYSDESAIPSQIYRLRWYRTSDREFSERVWGYFRDKLTPVAIRLKASRVPECKEILLELENLLDIRHSGSLLLRC